MCGHRKCSKCASKRASQRTCQKRSGNCSGTKMCMPKSQTAAFLGQSYSARQTSGATRKAIVSGKTLSAAQFNRLPNFLKRDYIRKAESRAVASNNNGSKWGGWNSTDAAVGTANSFSGSGVGRVSDKCACTNPSSHLENGNCKDPCCTGTLKECNLGTFETVR